MASLNPIFDSINNINESVQNKMNKSGDTLTGPLVLSNHNAVHFNESIINGTNYVSLQAPANLPSTLNFTLPAVLGTTGQVLSNTDGFGTLGWTSGGASYNQSLNTTDKVAFKELIVSPYNDPTRQFSITAQYGTVAFNSNYLDMFGNIYLISPNSLTLQSQISYGGVNIDSTTSPDITTFLCSLLYIDTSVTPLTLTIDAPFTGVFYILMMVANAPGNIATLNTLVTSPITWTNIGDCATIIYNGVINKWQVASVSNPAMLSQLQLQSYNTITTSTSADITSFNSSVCFIDASVGAITLSIDTGRFNGATVTVTMSIAGHAATLANTNVHVTTQIQWSVLYDSATLLYNASTSKWLVVSVSRVAMIT